MRSTNQHQALFVTKLLLTGVAAALVLERVILGDTIQSSINWALEQNHIPSDAQEWLDPVMKGNFSSIIAAIGKFGQSCHLPGSFQGSFYIAVHSSTYMEAVRENIMSGGDSCSRAHLIGALFAAQVSWEGDSVSFLSHRYTEQIQQLY